MTTLAPNFAEREARRERLFTRITKLDTWFQVLGLLWITPILRALAGANPRAQIGQTWRLLGVPVVSIDVFLGLWAALAPQVQTSLGAIPGPAAVWEQAQNLHADHIRTMEHADRLYARQDERNATNVANGEMPRYRSYSGAPTDHQQIWTSILTVFFGFMLATVVAVPLIFTGLRLSLGVGWTVLIAAEMLALNPGLGKFAWDEYQMGSSLLLAKIMVAVFTIGIIGFLLDRLTFTIQSLFTCSNNR